MNIKTVDGYDTFYPQTIGGNVLLRDYKKSEVPADVTDGDTANEAIAKIEYRASNAVTKDQITQAGGTSDQLIMSQKAVTNAMSAGGLGDMVRFEYDKNNDGIVNAADNAAEAQHAQAAEIASRSDDSDKLAGEAPSFYLNQNDYDDIKANNSNLTGVVLLDTSSYGTSLPSNPKIGQFFCLLDPK